MSENRPKGKGISRPVMGLPLYAWLAGGAALLAGLYFFIQQRNASSASGSNSGAVTPAQNVSGTTGYGIPVPVPYGTNTGSTTTQSSSVAAILSPPPGGSQQISVLSQPAGSNTNWQNYVEGIAQAGQTVPLAGPPVSGPSFSYAGVTSSQWQPVQWGGGTGYIWAPNVGSTVPWSQTQSSNVGSAVQFA